MKSYRNVVLTLILTAAAALFPSCFSKAGPVEDLVFFYFESCPSCDEYIMAQDFSDNIAKLAKEKRWKGKSYNLITPEAAEELKKTLQEKGLPDISRSLPLLIIGSEYINGYEAIGRKLEELTSGDS